jgi:hypothetical protein
MNGIAACFDFAALELDLRSTGWIRRSSIGNFIFAPGMEGGGTMIWGLENDGQ